MGLFTFAKTVTATLMRKPATLNYPARPAKKYDLSRGHLTIDVEACKWCGLCSRRCPTQAIEVDRKGKTWEIDRFRCVVCNSCVEICPAHCLVMESTYLPPATEGVRELFRGTLVETESLSDKAEG